MLKRGVGGLVGIHGLQGSVVFRIHRPDVRGGGRHVLQSQGLVLRARRAVQASLGDAQGL